jgi:hypothetical protein
MVIESLLVVFSWVEWTDMRNLIFSALVEIMVHN